MSETLMTDATTTTEGQAASEQVADVPATGAGEGSQEQQAAANQQAEGQKPADGKPAGAPENYEFNVPEGYDANGELFGKFKETAKELNLTQEQAQKLIDLDLQRFSGQSELLERTRNEWAEQSKNDKEFGGDKLAENLALSKKALDTFGTPELKTLLNESGLGNHPELIRLMVRAGKAISEDRFVTGGQGSPQTGDARKLYSASNMNP